MSEKDVCVIYQENKSESSFLSSTSYERYKAIEMDASGNLNTLFEGEWEKGIAYQNVFNFDDVNQERYRRINNANKIVSSFISDGWVRIDNKDISTWGFSRLSLFRESHKQVSELLPLSERMKIVNSIIQTEKSNPFADSLLQALEYVRNNQTLAPQQAVNFIELLERLTELHRIGELNDSEFEQAKKKALES